MFTEHLHYASVNELRLLYISKMSTTIFQKLLRWWNEGQNNEEFCVIEFDSKLKFGNYRSFMKIFLIEDLLNVLPHV